MKKRADVIPKSKQTPTAQLQRGRRWMLGWRWNDGERRCLLFCVGLSAGPEVEPFMLVGPEWEKKEKIKRRPPHTHTLLLRDFFFVWSCLSLCVSIFLSCLTHIASLHSSLTAALSVSHLPLLKPLALSPNAGLMLNWTRHYSSLSNTHIHNPSLLSSSTHSSLVLLPPQFNFFLLSAFVFTWVERKGRVKECDPDTPSSACSDRQANIPPADSWHAIVTCWILFQTVRPLVECLAFMSTCECVYVCVTVGLFHVTIFGICSKHAPFNKKKNWNHCQEIFSLLHKYTCVP